MSDWLPLPFEEPMPVARPLSVSELTARLKGLVEGAFGSVIVAAGTSSETAETIYLFQDAGHLEFVCHLPRHAQYGMVGAVHVSAA